MEFVVNQNHKIQPVNLTLTLEQYHDGFFPTLKANGVTLLHILSDGRIVVRSAADTKMQELEKMGFTKTGEHLTVIFSGALKNE